MEKEKNVNINISIPLIIIGIPMLVCGLIFDISGLWIAGIVCIAFPIAFVLLMLALAGIALLIVKIIDKKDNGGK